MKSSWKINVVDDDNRNQTSCDSSPVFPSRHPLESYPNLILGRCAALESHQGTTSSHPYRVSKNLNRTYSNRITRRSDPPPLFRPEETKEKRKKRKEERRKIPPISECSQSTAACRNLTEDYRRRGNVRRLKKQPRVACRSLRGCDVISIRVVFLHGLAEGRRGWKRY